MTEQFLFRPNLSIAAMTAGFKLEQQHGKGRVRVSRVWRKAGDGGADVVVEWSVSISLLSDCLEAYIDGNNSSIVATDTMKNTVCFSFLFGTLYRSFLLVD